MSVLAPLRISGSFSDAVTLDVQEIARTCPDIICDPGILVPYLIRPCGPIALEIARLKKSVDDVRNAMVTKHKEALRQIPEARAQGKQEGLEDAAKIAETVYDWSPNWDGQKVHEAIAAHIRDLAGFHRLAAKNSASLTEMLGSAAPAETQKPETGESDQVAVLIDLIEAAKAELAFAAIDEADGSATDQTRRVRLKSIAAVLEGVGNVKARRALGFLPKEEGAR